MLRRSEWMKLHETVTATDPQTGRTKRRCAISASGIASTRLSPPDACPRRRPDGAGAGRLPAPGADEGAGQSMRLCAAAVYALRAAVVLPADGAGAARRAGSELTEIDLTDGLRSGRRSAVGLTALGALWTAGCAVFLLTGGAPFNWAEAAFLVGGAAVALCGAFIGRLLRSLHPEELT